MHKGNRLASIVKGLLCFLEVETGSTNTCALQMPSEYLEPLIYHS